LENNWCTVISESVSDFPKRPPLSQSEATPPSDRPSWYWIANPNHSAYVDGRADVEDVVSFVLEGRALLEGYEQRERHLDDAPGRSQQWSEAIWEAARKWKVICGKIRYTVNLPPGFSSRCSPVHGCFPRSSARSTRGGEPCLCKAVVANRLGTGSKVATSSEKRRNPIQLIYIYTKDFANMKDIKRVLLALVEAGLSPHDHAPAVRYECDAYTYLKIYAKNKYGL
jgi:hypothetical protein